MTFPMSPGQRCNKYVEGIREPISPLWGTLGAIYPKSALLRVGSKAKVLAMSKCSPTWGAGRVPSGAHNSQSTKRDKRHGMLPDWRVEFPLAERLS